MAAVMTVYVEGMKSIPEIALAIFVDDRVISTRGDPTCLVAAAHRSAELDAWLGLEQHPDKRASAATTKAGRRALRIHASEVGSPETTFRVLGANYKFSKRRARAFDPDKIRKLQVRLRRIGKVSLNPNIRRRLARTLVIPSVAWQGAFVTPRKSVLQTLRQLNVVSRVA